MSNYQPGVTVITCTGGRPEAFGLCRHFLSRQTYWGKLQWIIVNDGLYSNGYTAYPKWPEGCIGTETRLFPEPRWQPGQNTLARNLLAAIPRVLYDKVLFMEDDDWYAPDYVQTMADFLETSKLVGDPVSNYYHVPSRRFRIMKNQACASLAQTGIRAELLPALADVCRSPQFIDLMLWQGLRHERSMLPVQRVVGMKGLPGRPGIGVGHQPDRNPGLWTPDPALSTLRSWIGDDAKLYQEFMK